MELKKIAEIVGKTLLEKRLLLATAESCTGGWVAEAITSIPGASACFERGVVSYSNASKIELLDVPEKMITECGAVSQEVAAAMAEGMLANSHAQVALSITGIAGPTGGTPDKPVGTVWFGWVGKDIKLLTKKRCFSGGRTNIRFEAAMFSLKRLFELLEVL